MFVIFFINNKIIIEIYNIFPRKEAPQIIVAVAELSELLKHEEYDEPRSQFDKVFNVLCPTSHDVINLLND